MRKLDRLYLFVYLIFLKEKERWRTAKDEEIYKYGIRRTKVRIRHIVLQYKILYRDVCFLLSFIILYCCYLPFFFNYWLFVYYGIFIRLRVAVIVNKKSIIGHKCNTNWWKKENANIATRIILAYIFKLIQICNKYVTSEQLHL